MFLAQRLWPDVVQTAAALYVAIPGTSLESGTTAGFNVEYDPSGPTLTIHSYVSQALYVPQPTAGFTPGAERAPSIDLLVVSTESISAGTVEVDQDGWIERLTGDERTGLGVLGTVAIS